MKRTLLGYLTVGSRFALALAGCAGEGPSVASDPANVDSFAKPTEHGALMFGTPNPAALTDTARFHAWTFTLSAESAVDLSTEIHTPNLDTVMYLYRKSEEGWGKSIATNDNDGPSMTSRLKGSFEAGEYMLEIKAAHVGMRGQLDVVAACTGDGCPAPAAGECKAPVADMPAAGSYTAACAGLFAKLAATPAYPAPPSCSAIADAAARYYKAYWNDMGGGEDGEGEPEVHVEQHPGAGTIAKATYGGDEDTLTFVFDESGTLRYYYLSNQSPDSAWFCDGAALPAPSDDCLTNLRGGYPAAGATPLEGTVVTGQGDHEDPHVEAAAMEYAAELGIPAGENLHYAVRAWGGDYDSAEEVKLTAPGRPDTTYVVSGDPRNDGAAGLTIVLRSAASGAEFLCRLPSK